MSPSARVKLGEAPPLARLFRRWQRAHMPSGVLLRPLCYDVSRSRYASSRVSRRNLGIAQSPLAKEQQAGQQVPPPYRCLIKRGEGDQQQPSGAHPRELRRMCLWRLQNLKNHFTATDECNQRPWNPPHCSQHGDTSEVADAATGLSSRDSVGLRAMSVSLIIRIATDACRAWVSSMPGVLLLLALSGEHPPPQRQS